LYRLVSILAITLILGSTLPAFSQREGDILYDKELVVGVNFHTNGGLVGGGMLRYSKKISPKKYYQLALELSFIKHPKELRYLNNVTNNTFIAYKKNAMFVIRPQVGYEYVLFRKADEEGVQIDFILAAGPSLGFLKPYYIEYQYGNISKSEAFDPDVHTDFNRVLGSGPVLDGIGESKVVPGFHIKPAISFELGQINGNVAGIETGFMIEGFTEKMVIRQSFSGSPTIENKQLFTSVYLTIYYGFRR
jgi:hypothetical protein